MFSTTLSSEYLLAAKHFQLSKDYLWKLSYDSIQHIFAGEDVKKILREKWSQVKKDLFLESS